MTPNTCETAYKLTNKSNKSKKYCNFCQRQNHTRSECYHLNNKKQNNYATNDWNKIEHLANLTISEIMQLVTKTPIPNPEKRHIFVSGAKLKQMTI